MLNHLAISLRIQQKNNDVKTSREKNVKHIWEIAPIAYGCVSARYNINIHIFFCQGHGVFPKSWVAHTPVLIHLYIWLVVWTPLKNMKVKWDDWK